MTDPTTIRMEIGTPPLQTAVLCRPLGGLNDTLCQIEKSWSYAERFDRWLVIDTRESGLHDDFSEYFRPRDAAADVVFGLSSRPERRIAQLSPLPPGLTDAILDMPPETFYDPADSVADRRPAKLVFDLRKPHRDRVLVRQHAGGGDDSFRLLDKITFTETVRRAIMERLAHLEGEYSAVHVRNTDYQTDYRGFFSKLRSRVAGGQLLVCSDDAAVIAFAKRYFDSTEILQASPIPDSGGAPLHVKSTFASPELRRENNLSLLTDLIALGRAKRLYITRHSRGQTSGYSRLARHLSDNRYVINGLLGVSLYETPRWHWRRKAWWDSLRRRADRLIA